MNEYELTGKIISIAIDVHRSLGPGLLENAYKECLFHKLQKSGIQCVKEKPLPLIFEGVIMDCGYRVDILVEDKIVLEIKSVESLTDIHLAQTLSYLRLGNFRIGLLINFNVVLLKNGIKRVINDY
jgi:GxxExxY protein